jgi:TonB family protein
MHLLLDDRLKGPRPVLGAVGSAAAHVALFVAVILGGRRVADEIVDVMQQTVRYLVPADRIARPTETKLEFAASPGAGASSGLKVDPRGTVNSSAFTRPAAGSAGAAEHTQLAVPQPTAAENAYSILDVDSAAVRDPASAAPAYPPSLIEKHVEGSAVIRFVVDSTGFVDLSTVQVIRATNPLFAKAVTDVLPEMRFRPAMAGNRPVRQLAELPFIFKLQRAADVPPAPAAKKP